MKAGNYVTVKNMNFLPEILTKPAMNHQDSNHHTVCAFSYSTMMPVEWKNWNLVYALFWVYRILFNEQFSMWRIFVCAYELIPKSITMR